MNDSRFYKRILNSMRDMVLVKGPKSKLLWANKAFLDYYGMNEDELRGLVDGPQSDPDDTLQYVRDDKFVFDTEKGLDIPSEPVTNSAGVINYFHTIKTPILDGNEMIQQVGVSRLLEDTVLQKQALTDLDAKVFTAPLRSIIDTIPIATILLDHDYRIIKGNDKWCEIFGKTPSVSNITFIEQYTDLQKLAGKISESLEAKAEIETVLELTSGKSIKYYDFKVSPWQYPNATIGGAIVVATDVTVIKQKELELEESNTRYELMAQGASVGIWDWPDIKAKKQYWSPKFYELLGYKTGEIEASLSNLKNALHPEDKEKTFALIEEHLKVKANFDFEYRLKNKSGEYRWYRGTGQASFDESEQPIRMVGSIQDIHERVEAEKKLKRSNEDLDQFAHIASHDLREPLRGMRNFSQFLLEDYSDSLNDEAKGYLKTIKKLGSRLEKYLDSLLYFSRLGREEMAYEKTDIDLVVREIIETFVATRSDNFEISIESKLPAIVCDPTKVQKIFTNLIQNSLRYNLNESKKVNISYQKNNDNEYQFEIEDNGIGIKKDHWLRIFTIFKRLHGKDKFEGGTGLGLTLVKKAVERHDGEVWIKSSVLEQGTCFAFTIKERK